MNDLYGEEDPSEWAEHMPERDETNRNEKWSLVSVVTVETANAFTHPVKNGEQDVEMMRTER